MNYNSMSERERLMNEINTLGFVMFEMAEYLDTHPFDRDAIDYFSHQTRRRNQALREYAVKYTPLTLDTADACSKEWLWALDPMPWEGGC